MYRPDNIHPLFVHFPIALLAVGYLFDIIGHFLKRRTFLQAGWYNLVLGVVSVLATVVTGFLADTQYGHMQESLSVFSSHGLIMLLAGTAFIILLALRFDGNPELPGSERTKIVYLAFHGLFVLAIFYGSHLGALLGDRL